MHRSNLTLDAQGYLETCAEDTDLLRDYLHRYTRVPEADLDQYTEQVADEAWDIIQAGSKPAFAGTPPTL